MPLASKLQNKLPLLLIGFITIGGTVVVNPWTSYDPINLPKMALVVTFAFALMGSSIVDWRRLLQVIPIPLATSYLLFLIGATITLFLNDAPITQQFWGVWGRSTGYLTYVSLIFLAISVAILGGKLDASLLFRWFARTSYFISFYTLIQFGDLDPISWSQKLPIATLGNINFMSSFLGLANVLFVSKLIHESMTSIERIHYLFFILLNTFLIVESNSIQGLAVMAVGIVVSMFSFVRARFGQMWSGIWLSINFGIGAILFLGTAGVGPLGSLVVQETVLYRLDYWKAGLKIFLANPIHGIGFDSYGDFYRQYRDSIAVERTGPQRVTNTAHNVFLDLLSGAGILVGVPFILVIFFSIALALRTITHSVAMVRMQAVHNLSLIAAWITFMTISINQIGVTVWGFAFLGLALVLYNDSLDASFKKSQFEFRPGKPSQSNKSLSILMASLVAGCLGLVASGIPLRADSNFLSAVRSSDVTRINGLINAPGLSTTHKEFFMDQLVNIGDETSAVRLARLTLKENPRSYQSLATIVSSSTTPKEQKKAALQRLIELDPKNDELKELIQSLLSQT